ncbi:LysR family transcriptional regulator, partial [Pseudomonas aeruginosa]
LETLFQDGSRASCRLKFAVPRRVALLLIGLALPVFFWQHLAIDLELISRGRSVHLWLLDVDCVLGVGHVGKSCLVERGLG